MGRFAEFYRAEDCHIPEHKQEEFEHRVKQLFNAGGMMELDYICFNGKKATLIRPVELHEDGFNACYNYFDDGFWENAGYSKKSTRIWSGKVGGTFFIRTVAAAYRLQEHYMNGVCVTLIDREPLLGGGSIGWLNYLFNEKYFPKNYDPWKLFESCHYSEAFDEPLEYTCFYDGYSFVGCCEIHAVLHGTSSALTKYDCNGLGDAEKLSLKAMKQLIKWLSLYVALSDQDRDTQLKQLMSALRSYYEAESPISKPDNIPSDVLQSIWEIWDVADAPAFVVKAIAEIYERDFWDLWSEIKDVARRIYYNIHQDKRLYAQPTPTTEFFQLSPDDMIFYWTENGDIVFSEDLWNWFNELKVRFDQWMETDFTVECPLSFFLNVMAEADSSYYRIYTFSQFFEESLEHMRDKPYLALWKLYEELISDPELKAAATVIYENGMLAAYSWNWLDQKLKFNKGRVTLRRYMALMANQPLRKKVLGV